MSSQSARARSLFALTATSMLLFAGANALASFTEVHAVKPEKEEPFPYILEHVYGGTFTANGADFSNGTINVKRISDDLNSSAQLDAVTGTPSSASDNIWQNGVVSARALSRFAGYNQSLGFYEGASGGSFTKLFDVEGWGYDVSGSVQGIDLTGKTYRWARGGDGLAHSSANVDNLGGEDHLVTYQVTGLSNNTTWLLFWEDLDGPGSDWDYNDLVVEVTAAHPISTIPTQEPIVIPLPSALWSGLSLMVGGGIVSSIFRKRRWLR